MPYKIQKSGSGYKVAKKDGGKTFSKKPMSKAKAKKQMAAIYANSHESFEQKLSKALFEDQFDDLLNDEPVGDDQDKFLTIKNFLTGQKVKHNPRGRTVLIVNIPFAEEQVYVDVDIEEPEPRTYDYPGSPGGIFPTQAWLKNGDEIDLDTIYKLKDAKRMFEDAVYDAANEQLHPRHSRWDD